MARHNAPLFAKIRLYFRVAKLILNFVNSTLKFANCLAFVSASIIIIYCVILARCNARCECRRGFCIFAIWLRVETNSISHFADPFGAYHSTNFPHGVGATLCRPAVPRRANIYFPQSRHAKLVRLRDFRAVRVRIKYPRANSARIFHYAVSACGPT